MTITTIIVFVWLFILLQTADWTIAHNFEFCRPAVPIWLYALIAVIVGFNWSLFCI
jgi:hypothetical protein